MASARRRNRTVWEVLDEVDRQPGLLRLAPATRTAVARFVADLRRYSVLAHERPAGEVLYAFLKDSGLLARYAVAGAAAEEALLNVARFFDIVRAQSALLADDRCSMLAGHLQTLIEAGDDPPTAELDGGADAVAVLTVHKAKGLEFPSVFLVGLVDGRFPAAGRRDPLAIPATLLSGGGLEGDVHLREERRLFYVGMTRARDELILSHAADYGGRRARRVSPFVLESLDLPDVDAANPAGSRRPAERLAGFASPVAPAEPVRRPTGEPLSLELRPGRRLPDLPPALQVRACRPGSGGAASRARLRIRAPSGRPGVPPAPGSRRDHDRGPARVGLRGRLERARGS